MFSYSEPGNVQPRIGVVGAGYWGANLIRISARLGVLKTVCDPDGAARAKTQQSYPGVEVVPTFGELLSHPIDAVIIATPAHLHAEMCLEAIRAGKHVFVEKPLALSVEAGKQVADAARFSGRTVFVGHLLLYHPAVTKMLQAVADGSIGHVWHMRTRRLSLGKLRSHENVWWSFAPHDVALMLTLMGEEPTSAVSAQGSRPAEALSDVAYADFGFSGERSAHVEVCWLDPEKTARLDVFGDQGVISLTDARRESSLRVRRFTVARSSNPPVVIPGEEQQISFDKQEPLEAEIMAFIEAIQHGKPFPTTAEQGVAVLRALSMADRSREKQNRLRAFA